MAYSKKKLYKNLGYWSRYILIFDFLEEDLEIVSPSHFVSDFSRKIFLMLHFINWPSPSFIVRLPLLLEILENSSILPLYEKMRDREKLYSGIIYTVQFFPVFWIICCKIQGSFEKKLSVSSKWVNNCYYNTNKPTHWDGEVILFFFKKKLFKGWLHNLNN